MFVTELARFFGVPLIDYRRESNGVLVASGCGIMMAAMDEVPCFRWCVDADSMRWGGAPWRIEWFMTALDRNTTVELLGVAGWFSLDRPTYLQAGLRTIHRMRTATYSGGAGAFDGEASSYGEFVARATGRRTAMQSAERLGRQPVRAPAGGSARAASGARRCRSPLLASRTR